MGLIHYNRNLLPKVRPSEYPPFECYLEEGRRKIFACNLLVFGFSIFKRATVIQKLDLVISMHQSGEAKNIEALKSKLGDVLLDSLIDNIRISVCFENYFKAKLLLNDIVIHNIDQYKNKNLAKEQKIRPIEVKEIIEKRTEAEVAVLNNMLKDQTINYSTILSSSGYIKLLNMPAHSLEFLHKKNVERNKLHLHIGEVFSFSDKIIQQYQELMSIADRDISLLQNMLLDELDPGSPSRLPIKL